MPRSGWLALGAVVAALALFGTESAAAAFGAAGVTLAILGLLWTGLPGGHLRVRAGSPPLAMAAGALLITLRVAASAGSGSAGAGASAGLPSGSGPWDATVVAVGSPLDGRQTSTLRIEVAGDPGVAGGPLVAASLPRYPEIEPGDRVRVAGALRAPGDDGYGRYLQRIGVVATLRSPAMEPLEPSNDPTWLLERVRRASGEALTLAIPEPEAGLAAGILIGLRDRVSRDLAADFTTAGVSHVVAISGWNIAIVGALVAALAGGLPRRRRAVLTIGAIAAYVAFAGASASVLRAALMAAVVLLARESGRAGRASAALGWAATLLLTVDPGLVLDPGFQLSSIATAGLMAWATPLTRRLAGPSPGRVRWWLAESLGVSLAAQAATLPIVLATFGRLSIVAPLVNLAVVPLVAPAMAVGALALVVGWLSLAGLPAVIVIVLGLPAWAVLSVMVAIVRAGAGLPFASLGLEPPWSVLAGALSAVVVLGLARGRIRLPSPASRSKQPGRPPAAPARPAGAAAPGPTTTLARQPGRPAARPPSPPSGRRLLRAAAVALSGGIAAMGLAAAHVPDGTTRIVVLDVGQGDAILVEGSRGGRLLVDTGPDPDRLLVALDERLPPWDHRLDAVVITHPHEDHVAGLALLLERYRIGRVLEPGMQGPGPGHAAAMTAIAETHVSDGALAAGDRLAVDDLAFRVLWPDPGRVPLRPPDTGVGINNVSIVLLGEVNGRRILLTGDAEQAVDTELVTRGLPAIDLLKVAHHGSATATTDALLDAIRPSLAVISVGAGNTYGHPAPSTLARLREHGAAVLRTDLGGTIEVAIRDGRMTARTSAGIAKVGWRALPTRPWAAAPSRPPTGTPVDPGSPGLPGAFGRAAGLLYHRPDDRARARRRRDFAPLPRSAALVPPPRAGGGGGGRLAGGALRRAGRRREPRAGRGRRAPP